MLNSPTEEKLSTLRLYGMLEALRLQHSDSQHTALDFDERFGLIVEAESLRRENQRLERLLREAKLKISQASVEDIDYAARREIDRAHIRQLATCRWLREHQNLIITGATGTGKTFIACAIAQQACRQGFRAIYRRLPRLFDELTLAHADGSYGRVLARLARMDLLILDDWGLAPFQDQERRDLLEILEDRYDTRSTIVTSQFPSKTWHTQLGDPTIADSICDRLLHNAHRIALKGPSRRKEEAQKNLSDSPSLRSDSLADS
jgi:DNA replication protein DnaC